MGAGWVGVNTSRVNHIVADFISNDEISLLRGYDFVRREPNYQAPGFPGSRFDLLLQKEGLPNCYVEIKNTTLLVGNRLQFPDAVTSRGVRCSTGRQIAS
jgi:sugar fermentation stimulation protein A